MLTRKQHELLLFIDLRLKSTGISPSFEEMKDALGLKSKSGIHRLINALVERQFIRRLPNRARALEVIRLADETTPRGLVSTVEGGGANVVQLRPRPSHVVPKSGDRDAANENFEIPLHGRIAAGTPIEALENVDRMISVPPAMIGAGDHYALTVSGDSMMEAGILDGDTVIIQKCETARDGDIIVALVDKSEATLKVMQRRNNQIILEPRNRDHDPQIFESSRVRVQGRLVGLLREY
jgi:repressor LexA